ncbi:MAG: helix-turn-helix transcriptional regulator [Bacteroidota bacterium]|nr:MAG: helix-turn-helix transcriptional regulator [Bacteroidota bacterium]
MEKDAVLYFYQKIGRNIKNIRREKDLKAFDVAAQLGIGESTYTKIERGETKLV